MLEEEGSKAIVDHALSQGFGGHMTQYKLPDWLISRQRYWGGTDTMQCSTVNSVGCVSGGRDVWWGRYV